MSTHTHDVRAEFQGAYATRRSATRYLVVHHAAALYRTERGIDDVRAVHRYHLSRGWPGIGYHLCLAEEVNGGPIGRYLCSDLGLQRAHVWGRNHEALGVACLTRFDAIPDERWMVALVAVLRDLKVVYPNAQIVGHTDIALPGHGTSCPGAAWSSWRPLLLRRVEEPTMPPNEHYPVLSTTPATDAEVGQAVAYITRQHTGEYTDHDVANVIIPHYRTVCAEAGVSFLVAVAQMIHETGNLTSFWSARPQRNPAGIGVTGEWRANVPTPERAGWAYNPQRGRWERGLSFTSWAESIPAQVWRLLGYAATDDELDEPRRLALAQATQARPLPAAARGSARTLRELGAEHNRANVGLPRERWRAGWAWPGTRYGASIARIMTRILETPV